MKRRDFVTGAAAVSGTVGLSAVATPAIAQSRRELTVVGFEGGDRTSAYTGQPTNRFFDWLEHALDGQLIFSPYAGEVPEDGEFEIAMTGEADAYFAGEYHWNLHHELFRLFGGAMPMGLSMEEFMGWFYHRGGERWWNELGGRFNIRALAADTLGYQSVGWFTEEIHSVDDFRGKAMDMPGVIGYIMRALGADAQDYILEGPIVEALRDGTMFAAERSSPANDMPDGYHRGAKYFYPEVLHEPHTFTALGLNMDIWNSLSPKHQRTIRNISVAHLGFAMAESTADNAAALRALRQDPDTQIMRFPREVMLRFCELSAQFVREEIAATDEFSKRVVDSYIEYRAEAMEWSEVTVGRYLENRRLPFSYTSS
jgi:TRAP-type mannitol/chloroaromatic compound transport system substrate-binding protein